MAFDGGRGFLLDTSSSFSSGINILNTALLWKKLAKWYKLDIEHFGFEHIEIQIETLHHFAEFKG